MFMSNLYMLSSNKLALKPLKVALIRSKVIYTSALFRQVRFKISEELDSEPTLPKVVTLFLSGGEAIKWYTTLTPTTMGLIDTPQPNCEEGP